MNSRSCGSGVVVVPEDRQAQAPDVREALPGVHRHPDRRVRLLQRPRHHRDVLDLVIRPVVAEPLARPGQPDDVERLAEAAPVLGHRNPEAVELARDRAAPHPELETAAGQDVGGGGLLRAGQRVVERQQGHRGADADTPGALGDHRHRHERVRQEREGAAEVQLGQPRHVEAQGVGQADEVDHLGVAIAVALPRGFRGLEEQSELH
jgi:hypothetical protein